MDFIVLIVRLTTHTNQNLHLLLLRPAILRDDGIMDMAAIHTSQAGRPHLSIGTFKVKQVIFYQKALTT
jgi:hypothetical protein